MSAATSKDLAELYTKVLGGRALAAAAVLQTALLVGAWWLGPDQKGANGSSLETVWQVHATFASVGFAGLAIAFQVLGDPPLTAGSARQSVVEYLSFRRLLASGVLSSLIVGAAAIWLANAATVAVAYVGVLAPSVVLVAAAYERLAHLFTTPMLIETLTLSQLESRMLAASTAAAAQEQAVARDVEKIDAELGLTSGALPAEVDLPLRQVLSPYPAAFVSSLRIGTMRRAADWIFDRASKSGQSSAYEFSKRVTVRIRSHRRCRPGDALFEMYEWPGLTADDWALVDRLLIGSVILRSESEYDSRTVFEAEMATLQDSVLAAVRDQQLARLERGFEYYRRVIDAARRGNDPSAGLRDPRWFERQIWEIDEAAAVSSDRFALVVISDAQRMAMTAVNTGDVPWLRVALVRTQHAWSTMLRSKSTGARGALESLLVSLQNLAEFSIPLAKVSRDRIDEATQAVVDAFATLAKEAFDAGEAHATDRVLRYMSGLWDTRSGTAARLGVRVATAQAAVMAWMLMMGQRAGASRHDGTVPMDAFRERHNKPDLLSVARAYEEGRDQSPWRFWESRDALPLRAQVLRFDEFYWRALLLLGADGVLVLSSTDLTPEDRWVLRAMIDAKSDVLDIWKSQRSGEEQLNSFVVRLEELVAKLDQQRRHADAEQELSSAKLDSFYEALAATVTGGSRLAEFLKHDGSQDADAATPSTSQTPQEPSTDQSDGGGTVSHSRLVGRIFNGIPRTFFIDSEVLAFPDTLGQQFGAVVLREQDANIVGTLLRNETTVQVAAQDLREEVLKRASGLNDPVIVYNGQPDIEELLSFEFDAEYRVMLAGLPAFSLDIGGADFLDGLLLIDRSTTPVYAFVPELKDDMARVPGTDVSIAIRALDAVSTAEPGQADGHKHRGTAEPMMSIETGQVMSYSDGLPVVVHFKVVNAE